ncbi:hypothetical protein SNEBB_004429 [Seison nebaliae]|nr:hypothetical protein SNEBB_004429 [Seison nebaliae]
MNDFRKNIRLLNDFLRLLPNNSSVSRLRDSIFYSLHCIAQYYAGRKNEDSENFESSHQLERSNEFNRKFEWIWRSCELENDKFLLTSSIILKDEIKFHSVLNSSQMTVEWKDDFNRSLLMYAIHHDNHEIFKFLLSNDNVNQESINGHIPLHLAVFNRNVEMTKLLLEFGADVQLSDDKGRTAIHWSICDIIPNCLKILLEKTDKKSCRQKDEDGMTPLMWACYLDRYDHLIELLHFVPETLDDRDESGRTAIHWSVRNSPIECLKKLLNENSVRKKDKFGKNCFHLTCEQGHLVACRLILQKFSTLVLDVRTKTNQTPLHLATMNGECKIVKLLMDWKANKSIVDDFHRTPLDYARTKGLNFCRSLLMQDSMNLKSSFAASMNLSNLSLSNSMLINSLDHTIPHNSHTLPHIVPRGHLRRTREKRVKFHQNKPSKIDEENHMETNYSTLAVKGVRMTHENYLENPINRIVLPTSSNRLISTDNHLTKRKSQIYRSSSSLSSLSSL